MASFFFTGKHHSILFIYLLPFKFKAAFNKFKERVAALYNDLTYKEVYLVFADAIVHHLDADGKAKAVAAIEEQKKIRSPQAKTIFTTVHTVMYG